MHGDEPQGKYIVEQLMNYIKNNPEIIENAQIMFIPAINPGGLARRTRVNAHKVDLNRNFPMKNWKESRKNSRYYSGSKPASEPEVNILINHISKFNPQTPGLFGTYFGKEQNISVITLETSSEDGYVAWQENKNGILEVIKYFKSKEL